MQKLSIVIADDEAITRMDLKSMLEEMGHDVVGEAENGEDAVRLARGLRPAVTLLDIMMPRMNGLEAAAVISRERLSAVVLLTAYSEASMIEKATEAGVLAYLVKPFRGPELRPALEIARARFREMQALEDERTSLVDQIETRRLVGQARQILMARHQVSEHEAYRRMQAQSLSLRKTLRQVAEAVILTEQMGAKP